MTLVPRRGILAIAAILDIGLNSDVRPLSAKHIATRYELAPRHLEPLLQTLVHKGLLKGIRGPRGGYELGRTPEQISVKQVIEAALAVHSQESLDFHDSTVVSQVIVPAIDDAEQSMLQALGRITIENLMTRAREAGIAQS